MTRGSGRDRVVEAMSRGEPHLLKTTGLIEPFREHKLRRSPRRCGASGDQVEDVIDAVRKRLRDGM